MIRKVAKAGKKTASHRAEPGLTTGRDRHTSPTTRAEKGLHRLSKKITSYIASNNQKTDAQQSTINHIEDMMREFAGELGKLTTQIYWAGIKEMNAQMPGVHEETSHRYHPAGNFVTGEKRHTERQFCPHCGENLQ